MSEDWGVGFTDDQLRNLNCLEVAKFYVSEEEIFTQSQKQNLLVNLKNKISLSWLHVVHPNIYICDRNDTGSELLLELEEFEFNVRVRICIKVIYIKVYIQQTFCEFQSNKWRFIFNIYSYGIIILQKLI